ncbi:hypothetical protein [Wenjunlia vitaminophila]|uniref:hypothetical protein n=1 Tax=Wenjunlia vitaminophila TaxID=76728 RepID=UPI00037ABCC7|nr:hypothetical protein [Wenjunlia vitaminophila]
MTNPTEGQCGLCKQRRPLFDSRSEWGDVPARLCTGCWSRYAVARERGEFVDWADAFDNASDSQLEAGLRGHR